MHGVSSILVYLSLVTRVIRTWMALALVANLLVVADVGAGVRVLALVDVAGALVGVVAAIVLAYIL